MVKILYPHQQFVAHCLRTIQELWNWQAHQKCAAHQAHKHKVPPLSQVCPPEANHDSICTHKWTTGWHFYKPITVRFICQVSGSDFGVGQQVSPKQVEWGSVRIYDRFDFILLHFTEEGWTSDAIMVLSAGLKAGNPPSLCSEICHRLLLHLHCIHSFSYDRSFCDLSLIYWIATSHTAMIWYIHSRFGILPLVLCLMYTNWLPRSSSASLYTFSLIELCSQ